MRKLSLSVKLLAPVILGALAFVFAAGFLLLPVIDRAFEAQGRNLGSTIPLVMVSRLGSVVAEEQDHAVQTTLEELAPQGSNMSYILVLDGTGRIMGAAGDQAKAARAFFAVKTDRKEDAQVIDLAGDPILDIRAPILDGELGFVHVGFSQLAARKQIRAIAVNLIGVLLLIVVLVSVVAALYTRSLIRPLIELTRITNKIADEGDLTQTISVTSRDEIGQLAASFVKLVDKLRQIPISLRESVKMLSDSVDHLTTSTAAQTHTISKQAAALQETQVTAQEIKQTSTLAAQKAEVVLQVAQRAEEISRTGEAAIESSLGALIDIRTQSEGIAEKIRELGERTRQIGGITQTVKDLADQSNMLALNAAIEAVRSGEHGKGFGVVAREIRSLADQSIQATNRVREILDDISGAIGRTVIITESGAQKMSAGLVEVKTSGENMRELSNIVRDNSVAVRQIAAAVSQQNAGIAQIFTAVTDLNGMMEESVSRLASTTEAAQNLKTVSNQVHEIVKSYRV